MRGLRIVNLSEVGKEKRVRVSFTRGRSKTLTVVTDITRSILQFPTVRCRGNCINSVFISSNVASVRNGSESLSSRAKEVSLRKKKNTLFNQLVGVVFEIRRRLCFRFA